MSARELVRASRSSDARRRYFDNGQLAVGEVPDPVLRSWTRCHQAGHEAHRPICFEQISRSRAASVDERSRAFIDAARTELIQLAAAVSHAKMIVILTDASGIMVESAGNFASISSRLQLATRKGVDFSEASLGTNAIGTALVEKMPVTVVAQEHYFESIWTHTCVCSPLFSPDGKLVGALDVSGDYSPERPDVYDLVVTAARAIENRLVCGMAGMTLLSFSAREDLIATPWEALFAFDPSGRLVGSNAAARGLLGIHTASRSLRFEELFDSTLESAQRRMTHRDRLWPLESVSGLRVAARLLAPASEVRHPSPARQHRASAEIDVSKRTTTLSFLDVVSRDAGSSSAFERARIGYEGGIPVLLVGETGTGKELVAQSLHHVGSRSNGPFVPVNCAALPETLVEAELFGYADGAFTGARRGGAQGRLELADGGTLFLDEIGDMPLASQAKLLRVLQDRCVTRLGDNRERRIDVSVICATHQDLKRLIAEKTFREDLYYRINGLCVTLPPLRKRGNILELAKYQLAQRAAHGVSNTFSDRSVQLLLSHPWPGNLRQLSHVITSASALAGAGRPIEPEHFPEDFVEHAKASLECVQSEPASGNAFVSLDEAEAGVIERTIRACHGNISAAARVLKVSRSTLYNKLKRE